MMKKILFIIFSIAIVALLVFSYTVVVYRNNIIKVVLEDWMEERIGLKVAITKFQISPLGSHIQMEGVTIENPPEFQKREMAYFPEIELVFDFYKFLSKKKIHLFYLRIDAERFNLIQDEAGNVNLKGIEPVWKETPEEEEKKININIFDFNVEEVYHMVYHPEKDPKIRRYHLGITDLAFRDVDSFRDIMTLIMLKIVSETKLAKALDLTLVKVMP